MAGAHSGHGTGNLHGFRRDVRSRSGRARLPKTIAGGAVRHLLRWRMLSLRTPRILAAEERLGQGRCQIRRASILHVIDKNALVGSLARAIQPRDPGALSATVARLD